jgi:hypothetical protein
MYKGQGGKGWAEDVWKGISNTGKTVNDFLKKTKIISKAGKFAKYILPAFGPEAIASIPLIEKGADIADNLGYGYSDMRGTGWNVGLTTLGQGSNSENVLTVSRNGTFQVTTPTHIEKSGVGILADNTRPDAGIPQNIKGAGGMPPSNKYALGQNFTIFGQGLGSFNVISSNGSIKV